MDTVKHSFFFRHDVSRVFFFSLSLSIYICYMYIYIYISKVLLGWFLHKFSTVIF